VILSNPQRKVLYVSNCWVGKTHDYRMFKEEFPPEQDWLKDFQVRVDLGFLGIEKDYVAGFKPGGFNFEELDNWVRGLEREWDDRGRESRPNTSAKGEKKL